MLRYEVGRDDLLRSRFALSPLFELDGLLRRLAGLSRHHLPGPWLTRVTPSYRELRQDPAFRAAMALHAPKRGAAFTAPPPRGLTQTIEDDLAAVRATPLHQARTEIAGLQDRKSVV